MGRRLSLTEGLSALREGRLISIGEPYGLLGLYVGWLIVAVLIRNGTKKTGAVAPVLSGASCAPPYLQVYLIRLPSPLTPCLPKSFNRKNENPEQENPLSV